MGVSESSSSSGSSGNQVSAARFGVRSRLGRPARISLRFGVATLALVPLGMLVVAGNLDPDPSGAGTHRQLGLPPCSLRLVLGIRCPACGMTTSWSHFAHGQFGASVKANAGGFLSACYAMLLAVTAAEMIVGRPVSPRRRQWLAVSFVAIGVVTLIDWGFRVA